MNYSGLHGVCNDSQPHLGGNISCGDPFTYSPRAWDYLLKRCCIESVLDLGCGRGHAAHYFHRQGTKVVAVDGLPDNIESSVYPALLLDLTTQHVQTRVDLVHCQEVVEHIEAKYVDNIIKSFQSGAYVCMTHAEPGQGGHHHVNLQTSDYWINLMNQHGFRLLEEDTTRVRALAEQDGALYLSRSSLVFHNSLR